MAEIEIIEEFKDNVGKIKKKMGDKNFYIMVTGLGAVGLYLIFRRKELAIEYENATDIVGYPEVDGEISGGGGSSDFENNWGDLFPSVDEDLNNNQNNNNAMGGGSNGGGSVSGGGDIIDEDNIIENKPHGNIVSEKEYSSQKDYYDPTSKNDAFWDYYNRVTGGGTYIQKTYEDGSKKTFYRPNRPSGVDVNGDGGLSVSFDRNGNVISSEFFDGDVTVSKYGDSVTTTVHSSDRRKENSSSVTQDVTTLPTYKKPSKNNGSSSSKGNSVTVSKSDKNKGSVSSNINKGYSSGSSIKNNHSTAKPSKPSKNAKPIG